MRRAQGVARKQPLQDIDDSLYCTSRRKSRKGFSVVTLYKSCVRQPFNLGTGLDLPSEKQMREAAMNKKCWAAPRRKNKDSNFPPIGTSPKRAGINYRLYVLGSVVLSQHRNRLLDRARTRTPARPKRTIRDPVSASSTKSRA